MKFLQTKPQVKIMNVIYYDLYYTVIKNRKEKYNEEEQKEFVNEENDSIIFEDITILIIRLELNLVKQY